MKDNLYFVYVWDKTAIEIDYDASWENGTGYLDKITTVKFPHPPGTALKFTDTHGRRGICIVTHVGNAVVFERHHPHSGTYVSNQHRLLRPLCLGTLMEGTDLPRIVGGGGNLNIGESLQNILNFTGDGE